MARVLRVLIAGTAFAAMIGVVHAAPSGKPVQTETITVPRDGETSGAMPEIPPGETQSGEPSEAEPPDAPGNGTTGPASAEPPPTIEYDMEKLPVPVRRLREQILEAAKTGDIEKLRPIVDANDEPPQFGFTQADDPIAYLKSQSGDAEGREILAILSEVLEAGYVHVDVGTTEEMYIWPYFARYPLDKLTAPQMVEMFKLLTAGDYEDMKSYGTYLFYRLGITPTGEWSYFVEGD
jgi:hypothetical protein